MRETLQQKRGRAGEILARLRRAYPDARCELNWSTPLELAIAAILSAQCTDKRVNLVTPALFATYRAAADWAAVSQATLEGGIRSTGFFRNKARNVRELVRTLVERHGGVLPDSFDVLVTLPGIGRKTANLLVATAFGRPGLIVDTHGTRVSGRLGLTPETDATKIEMDLRAIVPESDWTSFSHVMVFHGRYGCFARSPACDRCPLTDLCPYFRRGDGRAGTSSAPALPPADGVESRTAGTPRPARGGEPVEPPPASRGGPPRPAPSRRRPLSRVPAGNPVGPPPPAKRVILHVDMDAFFAAVEQRDRPELRGRPVVVGAPPHRRGVVAAASYEARRYGIHSAMPSREAGRRCPHAAFVPPDMDRYAAVSKQVFAIFERFSPRVEPLSIDEAFLDVTGAQHLFGSGPEIAERIRAVIRAETGLTASVGVATNKFLAKVASDLDKPDGVTVVPGDAEAIRRFLAPLPVTRVWGVGEVTARTLEAMGIRTIGDLQRFDPERLAQAVGAPSAEQLRRLADGNDDREVDGETDEKTLSREFTFPEDCGDRTRVERVLVELSEDVGRRLRAKGYYASVARMKLRWRDFRTITRQSPLDPACCDDFRLRQAARRLFGRERMAQAVRLIGFGAGGLHLRGPAQLGLFDAGPKGVDRRDRLSRTVDGIRSRYGSDSIGRAGSAC